MRKLDLAQGSDEWLQTRLAHFTASEAPIMMGASDLMSRDDLLTYKTTKEQEAVSRFTQMIFDKGHEYEAAARPIAEELINEELYPVTGTIEHEGLPMLASLDGITVFDDIIFEHKQPNKDILYILQNNQPLPPKYYWQLEQQLLVSGAEKAIFAVSDGNKENFYWCEYTAEPGRAEELIAGWKQFQIDLDGYEPKIYAPKPEPTPVISLPAINYKLNGTALTSNFDQYKLAATKLVDDSKKELVSDQDFADREQLIKSFKAAEENIKVVIKQVLGEIHDVAAFSDELESIGALIRQARLNSEKLVKTRKDEIKLNIINGGKEALSTHIESINSSLTGLMLPAIPCDFASAAKGKRNLKSMQEAINDALAKAKIEASAIADTMRKNIASYDEYTTDFKFLFNDLQSIITHDNQHFELLIKSRISDHKEAEKKRIQEEQDKIGAAEQEKSAKSEDSIGSHANQLSSSSENTTSPRNLKSVNEQFDEVFQSSTRPAINNSEFEHDELRTSIKTYEEREQMKYFFGEEEISNLFTDENGNEYELELIVHRKAIKNQAA